MRSIKEANLYLRSKATDIEIVKGKDYFYFISASMAIKSIYTNGIRYVTVSDLDSAIEQEKEILLSFSTLDKCLVYGVQTYTIKY